MKFSRILAGILAVLMVLSLAACAKKPSGSTNTPGKTEKPVVTAEPTVNPTDMTTEAPTDAPTETPTDIPTEAPNTDKAAYYEQYLESDDFGVVGTNVLTSMESSTGVTIVMVQGTDRIEWKLNDQMVGMYVRDGKMYTHTVMKAGTDADMIDKWTVSDIPEGENPFGDDEPESVSQGDYGTATYLSTETIDGIEYDKVELTSVSNDTEPSEPVTAIAYITTDTHKIARMDVEGEDDEGNAAHMVMTFVETLDDFVVSADVEEVEYDEAQSLFATNMMMLMFSMMPTDIVDEPIDTDTPND